MVALYQFNRRSPALLGCDCKYNPAGHPALRGVGMLRALGDDTVPAGTVLSYTAQWGNNFYSWNDPNKIQAAVQEILANQWGIVVDSQFHTTSDIINFSGKSGFTLQVHTTRDYGSAGDVKSIIDGALYNHAGVVGLISTIAITKQVSAPLATITLAQAQANLAQAQASGDTVAAAQWAIIVKQLQSGSQPGGDSFTDFLSNNWGWIAAGAGVLFLAREVL